MTFPRFCGALHAVAVLLFAATIPVHAAGIPKPVDKPYPGKLLLSVDATNIGQKIFRIHERIPAHAGHLVLLYPQWIPGEHSPTTRLAQLAGLKLSANGRALEWTRDQLDVYAFHVDVPDGATAVDADFQFLSALDQGQGEVMVTPDLLTVHWDKNLLYPAGYFSRDIVVQADLTLPRDWKFASALEVEHTDGAVVHFKPTSLEDFVDSPLYAGIHFKRFDLDPGAAVPVFMDVFADDEEDLAATPEQIDIHRKLLQQAYRLYGAHHFDHYDFLVAASDNFGFAGLEHHQSGENAVKPDYFTAWDKGLALRGYLIPHEFSHSWDGKFRRPADQWTPNLNTPMQNSLLWVYEGQTEFWGFVLAARSGLLTQEQVREWFAITAASYELGQARQWRALQDTTNDPVMNQRRPLGWRDWQRAEDYYDEGALIWLDADTTIREKSGDKRSLNDFAKAFFGVENGRHAPLTYTFEDVVKTLNDVQANDWAPFLRSRLDGHGPGAPLDGLARSGWKLVYTDKPGDYAKAQMAEFGAADFWFSLGFNVGHDSKIAEVRWGSPAFTAGLSSNAQLLGVNGLEYKEEVLKKAIAEAKTGKAPVELLVKKDGRFQTLRLDYHDGLRYPKLERIDGTRDRLSELLSAVS